ncbi:phosphoribosylformylglycinamidine synthase subunit PurS [bacterium BMS3Abin05]|nr:phosphoribosylformylglycinamidine synthase subunit PurS [bacterium BMS3Abin05]GBE26826.1 phosphoribosylformylglycinamidine synthase subunit PurS [bacterium BMS3Bbin03]HDK35590.1 phosphoribosylformylglycinamidine synthase subunit PurS [Bacteroidota bacterium]HDL78738.1 phosphoribosylformylglycinamidine synthase subunit PurS [Bacteroidota bacterium]HDZ13250.1 phosphoribosylformylglycinamidine synthase subunit PurS [Bacteroidota bacterium]
MIRAKVYVYLKKDILDPQGKAVKHIIGNMGFHRIQDVRVGKYTVLTFDDSVSEEEARQQTNEICRKLLANPVIEEYHFELETLPLGAPAGDG